MQKVFNVMAAASFVVSGTLAVMGVLAYIRVPSMMKLYLSEMQLELTDTIVKLVPAPEIPEMPQLPTETGPAIPLP